MKSAVSRFALSICLFVAVSAFGQTRGKFPFPKRVGDFRHQSTETTTRSHVDNGDTLRYLNIKALYTSSKDSLWIFLSRFANEKASQLMMDRMVSNLRSQKGKYSGVNSDEVLGVPIYTTAEKGKAHFFFRNKEQIFWLAGPPDECYLFLKEFLEKTGLAKHAKGK
ncbi:hypothetical protein D6833_02325 [Candidatus Parcubacteria bacterium]|nr:MAG: hypothetical protein D6833_02325 [Candidatus Parcubacteria bacterium]